MTKDARSWRGLTATPAFLPRASTIVPNCVLLSETYGLNSSPLPVSYTHLTLPTTPYV